MIEVWGGPLGLDEKQVFPPKGKSEGNVKCTFPGILPHLNLSGGKKENRTWLMLNLFLKKFGLTHLISEEHRCPCNESEFQITKKKKKKSEMLSLLTQPKIT